MKIGLEMMNKIVIAIMVTLFHLCISGCSAPKMIGGPIQATILTDGIYEGEARNGPVNEDKGGRSLNNQITYYILV
jgi:hypothetical protein